MAYRWASAMAWYEEKVAGNIHSETGFLRYLIEKGIVDSDMVQDAFQGDMILDGFFDNWPDDAPLTINKEDRWAECPTCEKGFSCEDLEDITADDIDCEMDGYEEPNEPDDENCPLKVWCRNKGETT